MNNNVIIFNITLAYCTYTYVYENEVCHFHTDTVFAWSSINQVLVLRHLRHLRHLLHNKMSCLCCLWACRALCSFFNQQIVLHLSQEEEKQCLSRFIKGRIMIKNSFLEQCYWDISYYFTSLSYFSNQAVIQLVLTQLTTDVCCGQ